MLRKVTTLQVLKALFYSDPGLVIFVQFQPKNMCIKCKCQSSNIMAPIFTVTKAEPKIRNFWAILPIQHVF
jgi:hypothetical protein